MKPYEQLTERGQVQRLKKMARQALESYDLKIERIATIFHGENTTFRAWVTPGQFDHDPGEHLADDCVLVRCHRPNYNSADEIRGELMWLDALDHAGIPTQRPLANKGGDYVTRVERGDVPDARHCTVMRWVTGRFSSRDRSKISSHQVEQTGRLTARLHEHARGWNAPDGFTRRVWDASGLFCTIAREEHGESIWDAFSTEQREVHERTMRRTEEFLGGLGRAEDRIVIHADLHFGNVLFARGDGRPIDFDDSGYGFEVQDVATTLGLWDLDPGLEEFVASYRRGYESVLPWTFEREELRLGWMARRAQMSLWMAERAPEIPRFASMLPGWLEKNTAGLCELEAMLEMP